jgi:hypothetical protein
VTVNKIAPRGNLGGQVLSGEERRRSHRVMIRVPVNLKIIVAGKAVTAKGITESVNDHGAMVQCVRAFPAQTIVELENDRTGEKTQCRVTRTPIENKDGYLIPLEFSAPSPTFWRISFPPSDWKPGDE